MRSKLTWTKNHRDGRGFPMGLCAALIALALCIPAAFGVGPAQADDGDPGFPPPGPMFPPEGFDPFPQARPLALSFDVSVYLPLTIQTGGDFPVYPQIRSAALAYYQTVYLAATPAMDWTGSHTACTPGTTSTAFREAVLQRINYFRGMAGVPPVTLKAAYNQLAQAAALMMSVNDQLSHSPPNTWTCYSSDGATGAGSSNLALGMSGPNAIAGYMQDFGSGNTALGHRRWILYPQTREMGTGDVPSASGHPTANALRVFDDYMWEPRPTTRDSFVAWPPPGYVPRPVVYPRWSFSYPGASFTNAIVTMTYNGANVALTKLPVVTGYGENTLGWEPTGLNVGAADAAYLVTISNVLIDGQTRSFSYTVTLITP